MDDRLRAQDGDAASILAFLDHLEAFSNIDYGILNKFSGLGLQTLFYNDFSPFSVVSFSQCR